jgi:hypothetical protein
MAAQQPSAQARQASFNGKMEGLVKANSLDYRMPPSLSVITRRSMVKHFFDQPTYSSDRTQATCVLSSGDGYVDGRNSYLSFALTSSTEAYLDTGSACNIIATCRITTESGVEVERVEGVNLYRRFADAHMCSEDWHSNYGETMGYTPQWQESSVAAANGAALTFDNGPIADVAAAGTDIIVARKGVPKNLALARNKTQYCIPLSKLMGLFSSTKLLPGLGLISGARIEIGIERPATALRWAAGVGTFEMSNCHIVLDTYTLSDSILKTLNQTSATSGLEVLFDSYDRVVQPEGTSSLNLSSKRAVSRAQWAMAVSRLTVNTTNAALDSMAAEKFAVESQQWSLAGLWLPNNPLFGVDRGAGFYDVNEHAQNAQYVFGKVRECMDDNMVSLTKFKGVQPYSQSGPGPDFLGIDSNEGYGVCAVVLERSATLHGSGLPVSGSRILQLRATYFDAQPRTITLYMVYQKLARVFLDRALIKE